jgi:hypothetical protein
MKIDMVGLIFICFGLFTLLMTSRVIRNAEDSYYAIGWKVNMRIFKLFWLVASIAFIIFGTLQIVGLIKLK